MTWSCSCWPGFLLGAELHTDTDVNGAGLRLTLAGITTNQASSLSDSGNRCVHIRRASAAFHDFKAHGHVTQRELGERWSDHPAAHHLHGPGHAGGGVTQGAVTE